MKFSFSKIFSLWRPLFQEKVYNRKHWEETLIRSDLGPHLTKTILDGQKDSENFIQYLQFQLKNLLNGAEATDEPWKKHLPWVVFIVGVNGVGKTTAIVKLSHYFHQRGLKIGVVGADTFRKAAIEQLAFSCKTVGVPFFTLEGKRGTEGADPSAVIFDGLKKFKDQQVILVDTSGRLHTKGNLMEELKKMKRVSDKSLPGTPQDIWLIIDASLGQNALEQGKVFHKAIEVTGLILTKMDGLSRGGVIFQLFQELKCPIRFIGFGEGVKDLETFKISNFIEDLFDQNTESP